MERVALQLELRKLREEVKLPRQKVAELSGISMASYERMEAGVAPSLSLALKLARFLEMPVEEIWTLTGEELKTGHADE